MTSILCNTLASSIQSLKKLVLLEQNESQKLNFIIDLPWAAHLGEDSMT